MKRYLALLMLGGCVSTSVPKDQAFYTLAIDKAEVYLDHQEAHWGRPTKIHPTPDGSAFIIEYYSRSYEARRLVKVSHDGSMIEIYHESKETAGS